MVEVGTVSFMAKLLCLMDENVSPGWLRITVATLAAR